MPNEIDFAADVLIVGAGPTGVALACGLHRLGVHCLVIDKELPAGQARAMGISARSLEILRAYGLAEDILQQAVVFRSMNIYVDRKMALSIPFDLAELSTPNPFSAVLPQDRVVASLEKRLEELGGKVVRPCKLKKLSQDRFGVEVTLEENGKTRDVRVRYVVGCDGAHSQVRSDLNLKFSGSDYEDRLIAADVFVDWNLPKEGGHVFLGATGTITAFPFPEEGKWRLAVFGGNNIVDRTPEAIMARLKNLMAEAGPAGTVIRDPIHTTFYGIHRRSAEQFRLGRCFVAGDAAHIHSPAGGQGMNTGIQDGFNLAWKLALVLKKQAPDALLDSYHDERHPVAAQTLRATNGLTQLITPRNLFITTVRDSALKLLGSVDLARKKLSHTLSQLEIAYSGSSFIYNENGTTSHSQKGPLPGMRAPDASCELFPEKTALRLFDFLYRDDTDSTLLVFDGLQPARSEIAVQDVIRRLEIRYGDRIKIFRVVRPGIRMKEDQDLQNQLMDRDGTLHSKYRANVSTTYLVRPDGHIAFRAELSSVSALIPFLETLFRVEAD